MDLSPAQLERVRAVFDDVRAGRVARSASAVRAYVAYLFVLPPDVREEIVDAVLELLGGEVPERKYWSEVVEVAGVRVRIYERPGTRFLYLSSGGPGKPRFSLRTADRQVARRRAHRFARALAAGLGGYAG